MSSQPPLSPKQSAPLDPSLDPNRELPPDADLNEHFIHFWQKNGPAISGAFFVLAVAIVGYQGWGLYQAHQEKQKALAYQQALLDESPTALTSFAERHASQTLGGLAYLNLADREFTSGDLTEALVHYQTAAATLKREGAEQPFAERALLGAAVVNLRHANRAAGMAALEELAYDPNALANIRAEAAYYLAGERWQDNNLAGARQMLLLIQQLPEVPHWDNQARSLLNLIPADEADATATTGDLNLPAL